MKARRAAALVLLAALGGGCNAILGIHQPIDPTPPTPPPDAAGESPSSDGAAAAGDTAAHADAGDASSADAGAGDGAPPPPPALAVATASLPDALYNVSYAFQLAATGGSGAERFWTLAGGTLPHGIELEKDGRVHGLPLQEGPFEFDVTVAEMGGATSASAHLTLTVLRKRWLVYRANGDDLDHFALYAVDVKSPSVQLKVSTNLPPASGSVDRFEFSPDGKLLAFLASAVPSYDQLYVVDMQGEAPGPPLKVNEFGMVGDFAWSLDSHFLAFADLGDQGVDVLVADVTQPQLHPERVGDTLGNVDGVGFVANDLLTYWIDQIAFARRSAAGDFGPPGSLDALGTLVQRWPDLESGLFASQGESCQDPTWTLVDFNDPLRLRQLVGYVSASPGRDHLAHRANPDYAYSIYGTWDTQPLATFPTGSHFCAPGGWSHDGSLFVAPGDGDTLQVTRITAGAAGTAPLGATAVTAPLAGAYGTVAEQAPPVFSPDDRWLGFSTNLGAYVAANNQGTLGAPVGGGRPTTAEFAEPIVAFSPDSTRLVSAERDATGRPAYASIVDLTGAAPSASGLSFPDAIDGSGVFYLGWSVHSTEVAFVVRDGSYPSPIDLYLTTFPSTMTEGIYTWNLTGFTVCTNPTNTCQQVTSFQFQP